MAIVATWLQFSTEEYLYLVFHLVTFWFAKGVNILQSVFDVGPPWAVGITCISWLGTEFNSVIVFLQRPSQESPGSATTGFQKPVLDASIRARGH